MSHVIGLLFSDIHLSSKKPRCRSEKDWWGVQARQLREVRQIARANRCRVLCAGDIFDRWNASPEVIRFALEELPDGMICVPGNHDLPYHDLGELPRSAYAVLEAAGKIDTVGLSRSDYLANNVLRVWGFGWGVPLKKGTWKKRHSGVRRMALVHKYVWDGSAAYTGASDKDGYSAYREIFDSYDVVHLGDNHKFWLRENTINPGSFYRRTVEDGPPRIGLLYNTGKIEVHEMESARADQVEVTEQANESDGSQQSLDDLIEQLKAAPEAGLDYGAALTRYIRDNGVSEDVASLIYRALEVEQSNAGSHKEGRRTSRN